MENCAGKSTKWGSTDRTINHPRFAMSMCNTELIEDLIIMRTHCHVIIGPSTLPLRFLDACSEQIALASKPVCAAHPYCRGYSALLVGFPWLICRSQTFCMKLRVLSRPPTSPTYAYLALIPLPIGMVLCCPRPAGSRSAAPLDLSRCVAES